MLTTCQEGRRLRTCGAAPDFTGITQLAEHADGTPLTLAALRARSCWSTSGPTSCINCQRPCPTSRPGTSTYASDGLVIVGVHTPEFAFEHVAPTCEPGGRPRGPVPGRHRQRLRHLERLQQPVLAGRIPDRRHRHGPPCHFGEGDYSSTERLIRELLTTANAKVVRWARTPESPTATPSGPQTAETYLGYESGGQRRAAARPEPRRREPISRPTSVDPDTFALQGQWTGRCAASHRRHRRQARRSTISPERSISSSAARVRSRSPSTGAVTTVPVSGVPRLYTLNQTTQERTLI